MAKLYHDAGRWVVPGTQGRGAARVDVPNSPEALAAWLNERSVPCEPARRVPTSREVMLAGGVDPDAPFDVGAFPSDMREGSPAWAANTLSADAIAEWILNTATQPQVEELFAQIGARWGEARR